MQYFFVFCRIIFVVVNCKTVYEIVFGQNNMDPLFLCSAVVYGFFFLSAVMLFKWSSVAITCLPKQLAAGQLCVIHY